MRTLTVHLSRARNRPLAPSGRGPAPQHQPRSSPPAHHPAPPDADHAPTPPAADQTPSAPAQSPDDSTPPDPESANPPPASGQSADSPRTPTHPEPAPDHSDSGTPPDPQSATPATAPEAPLTPAPPAPAHTPPAAPSAQPQPTSHPPRQPPHPQPHHAPSRTITDLPAIGPTRSPCPVIDVRAIDDSRQEPVRLALPALLLSAWSRSMRIWRRPTRGARAGDKMTAAQYAQPAYQRQPRRLRPSERAASADPVHTRDLMRGHWANLGLSSGRGHSRVRVVVQQRGYLCHTRGTRSQPCPKTAPRAFPSSFQP